MWISEIRVINVKSFSDSGTIYADRKMNILVGVNNSGKSILLRAIYFLQSPSNSLVNENVRIGKLQGNITLKLKDFGQDSSENNVNILFQKHIIGSPRTETHFNFFSMQEPHNAIVPFFSKRKVTSFDEKVDMATAFKVSDTLTNLTAKVDLLTQNVHPKRQEFNEACKKILGFEVTAFNSENGKKVGINISEYENISIETMGDGIPHILGLIANLCLAKGKIFLIEEIENDIHPKALKSLLELIIDKTDTNQFFVTTHSNIVTKYLGTVQSSKIHNFSMAFQENIPTSTYKEIPNSPVERREVLEDLGYDLIDSDIWAGWLFLEESTAERIIREYLIPWFAPKLGNKLRSISTNGSERVEKMFDDFYRIFLFIHLTPIYENKAWVVIDGDQTGKAVIGRLKAKYKTWNKNNFKTFKKNNFEEYYPEYFKQRIREVLDKDHGKEKQTEKKRLLEEVLAWINQDDNRAKVEFKKSAGEVITILQEIEAYL